ncbi:MAG: hypothetical protein KDA46_03635 [Parvularculaceae bacterium]|nr:hypothetical protein [Parvularculaceae bacterium]
MSDQSRADLAGELAYVRSLAEEGRNAPLVGGVLYVIWGGVVGVSALISYLHAAGIIGVASFVGGWTYWLGALSLGWALTFYFVRRTGLKPGAMTVGNKTAGAAWLGVGIFLMVFWVSLMVLHDNFSEYGIKPYVLFSLMFPVAFGVYGIAFFATAAAAQLNWMRGFAIAAWIFSVASLYYFGDVRQPLIGALGSFCCALLPGLILMRQEPSDTV